MALTDTGSLQVCKGMNQSTFNEFWGRVGSYDGFSLPEKSLNVAQ